MAYTCTSACASNCDVDCGDECMKTCGHRCALHCSGRCDGSCKDSCKGTCSDGCLGGCKGCTMQCKWGCGTSCSGPCRSSCSGDCQDDCVNTCEANCADDCQFSCYNTCVTMATLNPKTVEWAELKSGQKINIRAEEWNRIVGAFKDSTQMVSDVDKTIQKEIKDNVNAGDEIKAELYKPVIQTIASSKIINNNYYKYGNKTYHDMIEDLLNTDIGTPISAEHFKFLAEVFSRFGPYGYIYPN